MPWQQPELPLGLSPLAGKAPAAGETPRSIALGDRIVPYVLRRARRRTIGLSIDHRGLRVGAPGRASLREIEALIARHGEWVLEKLDEWRSRRRPEPLRVADGLRLPCLGGELEVRLAALVKGSNRAVWAEASLTLCLRPEADARRLLEMALRERVRAVFDERLAHYAALLGVPLPRLALSAARTRWGSCSSKSGIRLNWRLVYFPLAIIDYVVAHELAHLREMNHSPRFWSIVATIYPDHLHARSELKRLAAHCPTW